MVLILGDQRLELGEFEDLLAAWQTERGEGIRQLG